MKIVVHTGKLVKNVRDRLDTKEILRRTAFDVLAKMTERIHEKGLGSDGKAIGEYNNSYLKLRQEKYKRTADKNIIVSLTRQLENDWAVLETSMGWGIGFKSLDNYKKMRYVEANKNKKIAALTNEEADYVRDVIHGLINESL